MITISPFIQLDEHGFGIFNHGVVSLLLSSVESFFIQQGISSTKKVLVLRRDGDPMCCVTPDANLHLIFLSTKEDYWCQWVYQFSHEYCHHLIDGSLSGEWSNLLWFEETICELSSMCNLKEMIAVCKNHGLLNYISSVQDYLDNLMTKNSNVFCLSASGGWYQDYKGLLSSEPYKRDLYNAIAVMLYPLFMENPRLWKMIHNIGDIRSWNSLDALLSHLEANADDSYSESLSRLRQMFS